MEDERCPLCGMSLSEKSKRYCNVKYGYREYTCQFCGSYILTDSYKSIIIKTGKDKFAAYMYYHNKEINLKIENNLNIENNNILKYLCSKEEYEEIAPSNPGCIHVTDEVVENWYPKDFSEKVDMILCALADKTEYPGQKLFVSREELMVICFGFCCDENGSKSHSFFEQASYFNKYMKSCNYFQRDDSTSIIILQPEAWKRIDQLHKYSNQNSRTAFIAMSFDKDMETVRENIKAAISECGYDAVIMDEVEHNGQIVPEMLYQIRQAKFVVADLTKHNNGAYYEAGYALGIGKPVIQLCKKADFGKDGHFDVKQICTILWESESEIKDNVVARIKATIS